MKKILVAEDDRFLASAYKMKLSKSGYEVILASDGEEATKMLSEIIPDLILLDLVMPTKDGFQVLKDINANEKWRKIPVIIASNLGQKEDIELGKKLGAVDYIIKSDLSMEELLAKIEKILNYSTE